MKIINAQAGIGAPKVSWDPMGASLTFKTGSVLGLTTGGRLALLSGGGGQVITSDGGVWGVSVNNVVTDSAGRIIGPAAPAGIDPAVTPIFALPSYSMRVTPSSPIAGVRYGQGESWSPIETNFFIQRHKAGTRVNDSLCGKKCDLVWNATTTEWEVDSTATSVNDIVIAPSANQLPGYYDNLTGNLWDSATFATDTYGAWVVFSFVPSFDAQLNGLRY